MEKKKKRKKKQQFNYLNLIF